MNCLRAGVLVIAAALALGSGGGAVAEPGRTSVALDSQKVRTRECSLGNLVADAARASLKADVALVQANQFRATTIAAGPVTCDSLRSALLYPDEPLVLVELSGERLLAALERGLSALPRPSTAFLQVSGIAVVFRSQEPAGERVVSVNVGRRALAPATTYRAAMPASLAKGALGYFRVFDGLKPKQTGGPIGEALCQHVGSVPEVSPTVGQRLRDLTPPTK